MITSTATARAEDGGLASGLVNTTYQVGSAIGLAAMVAVAGSKTTSLMSSGIDSTTAMNGGFSTASVGAAIVSFVAAGVAMVAIRVPRASRQHAGLAALQFIASCSVHATRALTQRTRHPAPRPSTCMRCS